MEAQTNLALHKFIKVEKLHELSEYQEPMIPVTLWHIRVDKLKTCFSFHLMQILLNSSYKLYLFYYRSVKKLHLLQQHASLLLANQSDIDALEEFMIKLDEGEK